MAETVAVTLVCPDCAAPRDAGDNFCRRCGVDLVGERLPVARRPAAIVPLRPALPAPVKRAAAAVAVGTALRIGAGIAGRVLARRSARSAGSAPARRPGAAPSRATVVSEAVYVRRTWFERD